MCAAADIAEPAAATATTADKTAAADNVNQVGSGNDGAFEAGPGSPFNPDGSPRWNAAEMYGRWAATTIRDEDASRDAEAVRIARVKEFLGDH